MKKLLFFLPSVAMAMQIFVGQPFTQNGNAQEKFINNQSVKVIKGNNFTYYVKTQNGIVKEVNAVSFRMLAPASDFIVDKSSCTKKLISRIPLRMAEYEYDCPSGKYIYQTFGIIGHLSTTVWKK